MQISFNFILVACDWRPRRYNLHATGGHSGTIFMRLGVTRVEIICNWPPVACKFCMHLRPVACKFCMRLRPVACKPPVFCKHTSGTTIWIKKMKTPLKNLRIHETHVLASPILWHYTCTWPDPFSWDSSFTLGAWTTFSGTPQISRKFSLRVIVFNIRVQVGPVIAYDT